MNCIIWIYYKNYKYLILYISLIIILRIEPKLYKVDIKARGAL